MSYLNLSTERVCAWIINDSDFVASAHRRATFDPTGATVETYLRQLLRGRDADATPQTLTRPDQLHTIRVVSDEVALGEVDWKAVARDLADLEL